MKNVNILIKKISNVALSFYSEDEEKYILLSKVQNLIDFLEKHNEIMIFLKDFSVNLLYKKEILNSILNYLKFDEIFCNTTNLILDRHLIFYFLIFLNSIKEQILVFFNIKNVYVYSSIELDEDQKIRLENAWSSKIKKNCVFHYLVDESLKMGIKIQIDDYIEEYSIGAELEKLKNKLMISLEK